MLIFIAEISFCTVCCTCLWGRDPHQYLDRIFSDSGEAMLRVGTPKTFHLGLDHPGGTPGSLKPRSQTCCSQLDSETTVGTWGPGRGVRSRGWTGFLPTNQHLVTPGLSWSPLISVSSTSGREFSTTSVFSSRRYPRKFWAVVSFFNQSDFLWILHNSCSTKSFQTGFWAQLFNYLLLI